jgi:hypothetical protein
LKYKEKFVIVRKEKEELVKELEAVGEEVGSASMRKYVG